MTPPQWRRAPPIEFRAAAASGDGSRRRRTPVSVAWALVRAADRVTLGQSDALRVLRRQARAIWPDCVEATPGAFSVGDVVVGLILPSSDAPRGRYE